MNINYQYRSNLETAIVLKQFKNMLFPDLNKKHPSRIAKTSDIVIALFENQVVGLLVAYKNKKTLMAEAQSLFVAREFRQNGIGEKLLLALEKGMLKQGINKLQFYFRGHWPSINYVQKILDKRKWQKPRIAFVIVDGEAKKVLQLFTEKQEKYPLGFYSKSWSQISTSEKEKARNLFLHEEVAQNQNPFEAEESINSICSLLLFKEEEVVGWVVSHVISENTNEFTSYYISPKHRSHNLAYSFMRDTIYKQHELSSQKRFIIVSQAKNHIMSRFLLRHAEKTEVKLVKTFVTGKMLGKS